jgi:hypothetical protein
LMVSMIFATYETTPLDLAYELLMWSVYLYHTSNAILIFHKGLSLL